jgi:ubiquinone/menaquinone biosynthesis C-methylase UbiE
MADLHPIEPTGERFIPEAMGGELIEAEHQLRYRFALGQVAGKRVLDAGCGVGWGSKLLLEAGAAEVIGVDLSEDAIADCRTRVPNAQFVQGDLQNLPLPDERFDVVVCFEALEHTADTAKTLDELCRVMVPQGVLFVSSPNPKVYPAGNPFHLHELPPEELRDAVAARLDSVRIYRQHLQLSSLMYPDQGSGDVECGSAGLAPRTGSPGLANEFEAQAFAIVDIEPGHDPYSVAVASNGPLPELPISLTLAPSAQLDNLGALAASLSEEREELHAGHARVVEERTRLLAQVEQADLDNRSLTSALEQTHAQLRDAGSALAQVMSDRDSYRRAAETAELERDRYAVRLIEVEQQLAQRALQVTTEQGQAVDLAVLHGRLDAAADRAAALEAELIATRRTLSWRITWPLRSMRTRLGRRLGR